jgi:hypothetical protein
MVIAGHNLLRQVGEQHTLTENQGVDSSNLSLGITKTRSKGGFFVVLAYSQVEIEHVLYAEAFQNECLTRRVKYSFSMCQALGFVSRDVLRWLRYAFNTSGAHMAMLESWLISG